MGCGIRVSEPPGAWRGRRRGAGAERSGGGGCRDAARGSCGTGFGVSVDWLGIRDQGYCLTQSFLMVVLQKSVPTQIR